MLARMHAGLSAGTNTNTRTQTQVDRLMHALTHTHTHTRAPFPPPPDPLPRTGYDGKKVDVWAAGVLLFVMLAGVFPFETQDDNFNNTAGLYDIWMQQIKTAWCVHGFRGPGCAHAPGCAHTVGCAHAPGCAVVRARAPLAPAHVDMLAAWRFACVCKCLRLCSHARTLVCCRPRPARACQGPIRVWLQLLRSSPFSCAFLWLLLLFAARLAMAAFAASLCGHCHCCSPRSCSVLALLREAVVCVSIPCSQVLGWPCLPSAHIRAKVALGCCTYASLC